MSKMVVESSIIAQTHTLFLFIADVHFFIRNILKARNVAIFELFVSLSWKKRKHLRISYPNLERIIKIQLNISDVIK